MCYIIHRDIKPANLLVARAVSTERRSSGLIPRPPDFPKQKKNAVLSRSLPALAYPWGVVKILDMGLARCTDTFSGRASTHLTQLGSVMGTPEFIAPEQARDSHTSDIRADLYSLGCTLYFLLAGRAPFANGTATEKLLQHQMVEPEPVETVRRERFLAWNEANGVEEISEEGLHVPAQVLSVIRRLMAKDPDDRYQTPIELANELQPIVTQLVNGTLPEDEEDATVETWTPPAAEVPRDVERGADGDAAARPARAAPTASGQRGDVDGRGRGDRRAGVAICGERGGGDDVALRIPSEPLA